MKCEGQGEAFRIESGGGESAWIHSLLEGLGNMGHGACIPTTAKGERGDL